MLEACLPTSNVDCMSLEDGIKHFKVHFAALVHRGQFHASGSCDIGWSETYECDLNQIDGSTDEEGPLPYKAKLGWWLNFMRRVWKRSMSTYENDLLTAEMRKDLLRLVEIGMYSYNYHSMHSYYHFIYACISFMYR